MVSSSQKRILTWLSKFSSSIENAWDVTRAISLPGIAEGLGVVRSALNNPLKNLEEDNLVLKRMAHVIGGGSRRRQVYHLTEQGRELISKQESVQPKKIRVGELFGNIPKINQIYGREELVNQITEELKDSSLVICGLPGIGKTTLIGQICQQLSTKEKSLRWATANEFSDIFDICAQWEIKGPLPKDKIAILDHINQSCTDQFLIIDDIHIISNRHLQAFKDLSKKVSTLKSPRLILIGREPLATFSNLTKIKVEALDEDSGARLLGEQLPLEDRKSVSRRLGGHPLALTLYQPESELPEASLDIQNYVENTVLSHLDKDGKSALNLLSLEPVPLESSKSLVHDLIGLFDDQALLKWDLKNTKMEVHHLIRNVRRSVINQSSKNELHKKLAEHWQDIVQSNEDNLILLYHQIASSNKDIVELIEQQLVKLLPSNSNALAVLLEQALEQNSDNSDLHYLAAKVAIQRCEVPYVKAHLPFIEAERAIGINLELAFLEGRITDAEELIHQSLEHPQQSTVNRLAISSCSRRLDDRIYDQKIDENLISDVKSYLSRIKIDSISDSSKTASIIALTMIKHSLSLLEGDIEHAGKLTESVTNLGLDAEALFFNLRSKEEMFRLKNDIITIDNAVESVELAISRQTNSLYSDSIRLNLVETLISKDLELAKHHFGLLSKPKTEIKFNTYQRYVARWWLCNSMFNPLEKLKCLRESISQHRISGCPRAAKTLEKRLHQLI